MPKEINNLRNTKSQSSKPYDVSNSSFVHRATSRVLDLLPESSWLSRWLSPSNDPETPFETDSLITGHNQETVQEFRTITTRSDLNAVNNTIEAIPSKRPKLHVNSPFKIPTSTIQSRTHGTGNEELSPIMTHSEPSTSRLQPHQFTFSPLPVAPVPQLLDKVNGDDCSESSESTSGCSSLLPQAQSTINQRMNDLNESGHNRSMLSNASNMSLSFYRSGAQGRRPTFNTATFSSSLRSSMQDRGGGSPFYSGRTMYGGASGSNLSCMTSTRRLGPTVRPVKTTNEQIPLSSTAKKILDALEQFSSPILDAKRIPVTIGTKRKAEARMSKRYTELSIPTTTDLLRVKRRERLQKSTSDARQTSVASTYSNSPLSSHSNSPMLKTQDVEYKLRETNASQYIHQKSAGKLRTRRKDRQQDKDITEEDTIADVRLPNVKLPLKSLPSIDIKIPPHTSVKGLPFDGSYFSFSAPLEDKNKCTSNTPLTTPTVNFKFSEPLNEIVKSDNNSNSKSVMNFNFVSSPKAKNEELKTKLEKTVANEVSNKQNIVKPAAQLQTGSVMDVLVNKKNRPDKSIDIGTDESISTGDSWKCVKCYIKNAEDATVCVACGRQKLTEIQKCTSPKSNTWKCAQCFRDNTSIDKTVCSSCGEAQVKLSNKGFGDKFKTTAGSWECKVCLIINKPDATKCIACETVNTDNKKNAPNVDSGFGNMFKPSAGSWECKSCLVINKADLINCAACMTQNSSNVKDTVPVSTASGFGNLFKKPTGSWECGSCMLQNDSDKNKCAACETPKSGVKVSETRTNLTNNFSFGIPKGMDNVSLGFKFGGFKSAEQSSGMNTTATFNFGIPNINVTENNSSMTTSLPKATSTFQFGMSNQLQPSSTETFSFGILKKDENTNLLTNGGDKKSQVDLKETKSDSKCELKNEALKSVSDSKKEQKHITSKLVESNNPENLKKSTTISSNINSKASDIFSFGASKTTSNKIIDEQNEKTKSLPSKPFLEVQSVTSVTPTCTSLSTSTTVTSSGSSNILKMGTSKTIAISSETKNVSPIVTQNTLLGIGSTNESKNGVNVVAKTIESKPNVFNACNDTKPSFVSFQPSLTNSASTFGVAMPPIIEHKVSNRVCFDTKSSTFTPVVNKEQTPTHLVPQTTTPNIFGSDTPATQQTTPNVFGTAATTSSVAAFPAFGTSNSFPSAIVNPTVSENKSLFTFGASGNKPSELSTSFGFTASAANNSSNAGFVFNPVTSRNTGFNIIPKVESKAPVFSSNVSFGSISSASNPSVFGTPQSAPSFGEAATASPVFAFGSGTQTQQPASTLFGFGTPQNSVATAPAASPAFIFGATPSSSSVVPAFDPNARPTFNFTGGAQPSTFTASPSITPSATPIPQQRKIRKAVRRQPTRQ